MKVHELRSKMTKDSRKRRGQGNATGNGTYGGRGCKGQNSRAGGGVRLGFEGGQTPLIQRMPMAKGFRNPNKVEAQVVSLEQLEGIFKDGDTVNLQNLLEAGLIHAKNAKVKILANGTLSKKLTIDPVLSCSAQAIEAIKKAGGVYENPESKEKVA